MKGLALHPVNGRVYAKVPTSPATSELDLFSPHYLFEHWIHLSGFHLS
jgi:hypothetical protein